MIITMSCKPCDRLLKIITKQNESVIIEVPFKQEKMTTRIDLSESVNQLKIAWILHAIYASSVIYGDNFWSIMHVICNL